MILINIVKLLVDKGLITEDEAMQVSEFPPAWQPDGEYPVSAPQWAGKYIGARYVPKLMGRWSDSIAYEPLMIVQDEIGNSFTSKSNVPVGTPLSDTKYWVQTGNYNGQIGNLETLIDLVTNGLNQEISQRKESDNELNNKLLEETTNRTNADTELRNKIENTNINVDTVRYHVYVSKSGRDSNPGTQALPFLTLDRAMLEFQKHTSLYINFMSEGTYSYSYLNVSDCILHMYNKSGGVVTINFPTGGQMYRMHLNWSNMTLNFNTVYFDECGIYFTNCVINTLLKAQGGIMYMRNCTYKDTLETHGLFATINVANIEVANTWLRLRDNSIAYIANSITISEPTSPGTTTLISVEAASKLTLGTSPSSSVEQYYTYLINVSNGIVFSNRTTLNNYKNLCKQKLINTSGFYLLLESNGFFNNTNP